MTRARILALAVLATLALASPAHAATGPCDIYGGAGTPCVAAHSTVRALFASYNGRSTRSAAPPPAPP